MKFTIALLCATAGLAAAQPHRHHHRHAGVERRDPTPADDVVNVPGPTIVVYELNGSPIPESEVEEGIKNGTLVWSDNGLSAASSSSTFKASSTPAPSPSSVSKPASSSTPPPPSTTAQSTTSSAAAAPTTTEKEKEKAKDKDKENSKPSATASAQDASSGPGYGSSGKGADDEFPDGQIDCSHFPSDYGAIAVDWLGLGGWTGIQQPNKHGSAGFDDIMTVTRSTCGDGGSCCQPGMYCSYACKAGYQKSQWPGTQGATGQSVGGIYCGKDNKLHLTNSASKHLCMAGTSSVTVQVQNKMDKNAAVCRTDYPGTESETVPLDTQPGQTYPLTCPDASNYYQWQGKSTSAQYYLNPAGVSVKNACQWGDSSNPWGNFAPMNLGVGYSGGSAWLSIFQNAPTTNAKLDFTVEIVGDHVVGKCKYVNGQYCAGDNYDKCDSNGCTVSAAKGTVTYVFSSS